MGEELSADPNWRISPRWTIIIPTVRCPLGSGGTPKQLPQGCMLCTAGTLVAALSCSCWLFLSHPALSNYRVLDFHALPRRHHPNGSPLCLLTHLRCLAGLLLDDRHSCWQMKKLANPLCPLCKGGEGGFRTAPLYLSAFSLSGS